MSAPVARTHRVLPLALLALLVTIACAPGCEPPSEDGSSGKLSFNYADPDGGDPSAFDSRVDMPSITPIETGLRAQVNVYTEVREGDGLLTWWTKVPADVVNAYSTDPMVFTVDGIMAGAVVVRGVAPGTAELRVETEAGEDSIPIVVADLADYRLSLYSGLFDERAPTPRAHLVGTAAIWDVQPVDAEGRAIRVHYEHHALPEVSPAGAAEVRWLDAGQLEVVYLQRGRVLLSFPEGEPIEQLAVDQRDLVLMKLARWSEESGAPIVVDDGGVYNAYAVTQDGEAVLGVMAGTEFWTETPEVCSAQVEPDVSLLWVSGLAPGQCEVRFEHAEFGISGRAFVEVVTEP